MNRVEVEKTGALLKSRGRWGLGVAGEAEALGRHQAGARELVLRFGVRHRFVALCGES